MPQPSDAQQMELRLPFGPAQAIPKIAAALESEGFGILTRIDVKATLKAKLGVDFHEYVILGACNPSLAHRALGIDQRVGLGMPCNVVVSQESDGSLVRFADPVTMLGAVAASPAVAEVAREARCRLRRVADSLRRG